MKPRPKTSPAPILCVLGQLRAFGVPFDIATDGVKVIVLLDGKRFVGSLVQVPKANAPAKESPATNVRGGEPLHEIAQLAVLARPENQMPMIGHQAPSKNSHRDFFLRLVHDSQKCEVVEIGFENRFAIVAPVEDMKDGSAGCDSCCAWHRLKFSVDDYASQ